MVTNVNTARATKCNSYDDITLRQPIILKVMMWGEGGEESTGKLRQWNKSRLRANTSNTTLHANIVKPHTTYTVQCIMIQPTMHYIVALY